MAVPTITLVAPSSGPAGGGNRVVITGANFREYTAAASGFVGSVAVNNENVAVLFNGVAALTQTISATEIDAVPPMYTGDETVDSFPAVDVLVRNLDDDGAVIPGEEVTLSSAYTYIRADLRPPTLTTESPLVRITDTLVQLLKRQVLANASLATDTDYSADGIVIKNAEVPSLTLTGPAMTQDAYGWESPDIEVDNGDGTVDIWPNPIYHTFAYGLSGGSDSSMELHRLMGAARQFAWRNPYVVISADIPTSTEVRMPLIMTDEPDTGRGIMDANYHTFSCSFELRRIPIMYLPPYARVKPVDILELQTQLFTGTLVETKDLW
jgi:hypothetical protein